ncbi:CHAT domain-containing protein [Streptomyces sp. NPDC051211]|uniref:CHAT domain-containing protein n=1 Tax=Streptomyces sp. NPDC051211 TaxID=3154643 RepID=UPI00344ECB9B
MDGMLAERPAPRSEADTQVALWSRYRATGLRLASLPVLAASLPLALSLWDPLPAGTTQDRYVRLLAGALLAGALWRDIWVLRFLSLPARTVGYLYFLLLPPLMWWLAGTEAVGSLVTDGLAPGAPLGGGAGIALLCTATVLAWCAAEGVLTMLLSLLPYRLHPAATLLIRAAALLSLLRLLTGRGLLLFFAGAVFRPTPSAIAAVCALAAVEFALALLSESLFKSARKRWFDAHRLAVSAPLLKETTLAVWAVGVCGDPGSPRRTRLCFDAVTLAKSALYTKEPRRMRRGGQAGATSVRSAIRGGGFAGAEAWHDLAERALRALERQAADAPPSAELERLTGTMRGELAASMAFVAEGGTRWDEALHLRATAYTEFARAGLVNLAAFQRLAAASILSVHLDLPDEAEEVLGPVLADPGVAVAFRRMAAVGVAGGVLIRRGRAQAQETWRRLDPGDGDDPAAGLDAALAESPTEEGVLARAVYRRLIHMIVRVTVGGFERELAAAQDSGRGPGDGFVPDLSARLLMAFSSPVAVRRYLGELQRASARQDAGSLRRARRRARRNTDRPGSPDRIWLVHSAMVQRAVLALDADDALEAYRLLKEAFVLMEESRTRVTDPRLRVLTDFEESAYDLMISLLVASAGRPGFPGRPYSEALRVSELARSRTLLELLAEPARTTPPPDIRELVEAEESALEAYLRERAGKRAAGDGTPGLDRRSAAWHTLTGTWDRLSLAGDEGAEYVQLRRGTPATYEELQLLMPPDSAVFAEFFISEAGVLVFVGRRDYAEPVVVSTGLSRADIERGLSGLGPHTGEGGGDAWQALLRPLVAALADHCAPGDLVWLVPHGPLHHVPLHALPLGDAPLVVRNPVCVTPSASVMRFCRARGQGGEAARRGASRYRSVLTLADSRPQRPLAHARAEAGAVGSLFPGGHLGFTGGEVTRDRLREALAEGEHDVIHIACHGTFDERHPQDSGIELADGDRLTVRDLMGLRLRTRLIVLSACESGRSSRRSGDELIGLTRALLYAGAPTALVSLWRVDDNSTGLLMRRFYQALLSGMSKADALRCAQRAVLTATVREAVAHCEQARHDLGPADRTGLLDEDIATLRCRAGDFGRAAVSFDRAAMHYAETDPKRRTLLRAAAWSRSRERESTRPPDYDLRPYRDPYHWAPFVLVGDWS